jgi:hypothetical protein
LVSERPALHALPSDLPTELPAQLPAELAAVAATDAPVHEIPTAVAAGEPAAAGDAPAPARA